MGARPPGTAAMKQLTHKPRGISESKWDTATPISSPTETKGNSSPPIIPHESEMAKVRILAKPELINSPGDTREWSRSTGLRIIFPDPTLRGSM